MMTEMLIFAAAYGFLAVLNLYRLLKGPTAADRMVSADNIDILVCAALVLYALYSGRGIFLDISIICALLPRPKLLLLDEPMLGLDPHAIKELRQLVQELAEDGVAVLISTHMISTVEGIWNKAYIMRKGKVISCHRKEEMIGMWAESLERIFFAETESYDSPWVYEETMRPTAPAPAQHKNTASHGKQVSHPNTGKKKKSSKKKKK